MINTIFFSLFVRVADKAFFIPGNELYPWEINYLTSHYQSSRNPDLVASQHNAGLKICAYLSLDVCVEGLKLVSERLFGITMEERELGKHEKWTTDGQADKIKKYLVFNSSDGSEVGVVYMDLFSRKNKFKGAAHFTVRCGFDNTKLCDSM